MYWSGLVWTRVWHDLLLSAIPAMSADSVVLEIGSGRVPLEISGCNYISVDLKRVVRFPGVIGSAEALPVRSDIADMVVGSRILCSVQSISATLLEIARVMKPGGIYVGLEHCKDPWLVFVGYQNVRNLFRARRGLCRLGVDVCSELSLAGFDFSIRRTPLPLNPVIAFQAAPRLGD
ncbi:hypothetical protein GCM10023192_34550 [Amycolatopsis samaneae]